MKRTIDPILKDCLLVTLPIKDHFREIHGKEQFLARNFRSPKRVCEFSSGRLAAKTSLIQAGFLPLPIGKGEQGAPLWPPGAIASLAHDNGLAGCLIAQRGSQVRSLGLDFELRSRSLGAKLFPSLFSTPEVDLVQEDLSWKPLAAFCAKEAIYKCLNPLTKDFFDFKEVQITSLEPQSFTAEFQDIQITGYRERFGKIEGVIRLAQERVIVATGINQRGEWLGKA